MANKFQEAMRRMFGGVFVCRKCKTKNRSNVNKIIQRKVKYRRFSGKQFRDIKKAINEQIPPLIKNFEAQYVSDAASNDAWPDDMLVLFKQL